MAQQNALFIKVENANKSLNIYKVKSMFGNGIEATNSNGDTVLFSTKNENFKGFCNSKGERYFAFGGEE